MGSTGSGSFTDYPGGRGGQNKCEKGLAAKLEDIEHCDYFKAHKDVPPKGTVLVIAQKKRVVAQTETGEVVGNLPTEFNYLAGCLAKGYTYTGHVIRSSSGPVALVSADFGATNPK